MGYHLNVKKNNGWELNQENVLCLRVRVGGLARDEEKLAVIILRKQIV